MKHRINVNNDEKNGYNSALEAVINLINKKSKKNYDANTSIAEILLSFKNDILELQYRDFDKSEDSIMDGVGHE